MDNGYIYLVIPAKHQLLISDRIVNNMVLTTKYLFSSPFTETSVDIGRNSNGLEKDLRDKGNTLKDDQAGATETLTQNCYCFTSLLRRGSVTFWAGLIAAQ